MNRINKEIDEYFAEIKRNLICSPSQKNTIINDLRESVVNYVEENNIDDIKKVYAQFGTPQDIADQSISDTEPQKIKKTYNHHHCLFVYYSLSAISKMSFSVFSQPRHGSVMDRP